MEKKYDKWGRELYPMTAEEQKIYDRLMEEHPSEVSRINAILLDPPGTRDWEELEGILEMYG